VDLAVVVVAGERRSPRAAARKLPDLQVPLLRGGLWLLTQSIIFDDHNLFIVTGIPLGVEEQGEVVEKVCCAAPGLCGVSALFPCYRSLPGVCTRKDATTNSPFSMPTLAGSSWSDVVAPRRSGEMGAGATATDQLWCLAGASAAVARLLRGRKQLRIQLALLAAVRKQQRQSKGRSKCDLRVVGPGRRCAARAFAFASYSTTTMLHHPPFKT